MCNLGSAQKKKLSHSVTATKSWNLWPNLSSKLLHQKFGFWITTMRYEFHIPSFGMELSVNLTFFALEWLIGEFKGKIDMNRNIIVREKFKFLLTCIFLAKKRKIHITFKIVSSRLFWIILIHAWVWNLEITLDLRYGGFSIVLKMEERMERMEEDGGIVNLEREISVICVYRILVELHVSGFLDATQE